MLRFLGAFFLSVILNNACAVGVMPKQLFRPLWRGAVGDGSPAGTLTLGVSNGDSVTYTSGVVFGFNFYSSNDCSGIANWEHVTPGSNFTLQSGVAYSLDPQGVRTIANSESYSSFDMLLPQGNCGSSSVLASCFVLDGCNGTECNGTSTETATYDCSS